MSIQYKKIDDMQESHFRFSFALLAAVAIEAGFLLAFTTMMHHQPEISSRPQVTRISIVAQPPPAPTKPVPPPPKPVPPPPRPLPAPKPLPPPKPLPKPVPKPVAPPKLVHKPRVQPAPQPPAPPVRRLRQSRRPHRPCNRVLCKPMPTSFTTTCKAIWKFQALLR